jgi:hypothetical protein
MQEKLVRAFSTGATLCLLLQSVRAPLKPAYGTDSMVCKLERFAATQL